MIGEETSYKERPEQESNKKLIHIPYRIVQITSEDPAHPSQRISTDYS